MEYKFKKVNDLEKEALLYGSNSTAFTEMMNLTKRTLNPYSWAENEIISDGEMELLEKVESYRSKGLTVGDAINRVGLNHSAYYKLLNKKYFRD